MAQTILVNEIPLTLPETMHPTPITLDVPEHENMPKPTMLVLGGHMMDNERLRLVPSEIWDRATMLDYPVVTTRKRRAKQACHMNSMRYVLHDFPNVAQFATGWALTMGYMWNAHSWCIQDGKIVETTSIRDAYYGVVLTWDEFLEQRMLFHGDSRQLGYGRMEYYRGNADEWR